MFYGFHYEDGINTTRGGDSGIPLRIAGYLYSFETKAARDTWVAEGYAYRVPRDAGEFRVSVSARGMPSGWRADMAQSYAEHLELRRVAPNVAPS